MNSYSITHANGLVDVVKGSKIEHNKDTGQTIIYKTEMCLYEAVAVVPATSFVMIMDQLKTGQREFANIETSKDV